MAGRDPAEEEDIPRLARQCWDRYRQVTEQEREAEKESIGFWIGGKHQWRQGEVEEREANNQPWLSINRCKPAVDQIENEARNNPPGPEAIPVGSSGADKDGADINEGLIREYNYRCDGDTARILALRMAAASGRGLWELGTEYVNDRSMEQQVVVKSCPDPSLYFYDPEARMPSLEDAMWGGKIRKLSREQIIEEFPDKDLKILSKSALDSVAGSFGGWMRDAFGFQNDWSTISDWTGGGKLGPYYVCEFYRVKLKKEKLTYYSDDILRFDNEPVPEGIKPQRETSKGMEISRWVPRRRVVKYIVTALDLIESTDWPGTIIPHLWVLGPEMWRDGKRYRLSAITNAEDAQRGLNYTATSAAQIVGTMTKTPWLGALGAFDVQNAQGINPWDQPSSTYAYMEYKPTFAESEANPGQSTLNPPPIRNTWEAPIQRLMELANFFGEQIKAATSVFFEPSLPSAADAQSGSAIKALQQQTNIGTLNWQKALLRTATIEFQQAGILFKKLYDGPRVRTIVRADSQHEIAEINREFPPHEIEGGKHRTKDGKYEPLNNISRGDYMFRAIAGPSFETRNDEAIEDLTEIMKMVPGVLASPAVLAKFIRLVARGNPIVNGIADSIAPDPSLSATPEQMQAQLQQAGQQIQVLKQFAIEMKQKLDAKLPQVEADRYKAELDALVKVRVAEINASKDADHQSADIEASQWETHLGLAHEVGMQAQEHAHQSDMADKQAAATQLQSIQDAALTPAPQGEENG